MKEKDLDFDRKKHICYSNGIKRIIQDRLIKKYPHSEAVVIWQKIQHQYVKFLEDLPYLGGKKCVHNGAGGTYDCIALFAYYEVQEVKPTIQELYEMNNEILLPPFVRLGKIFNINNKFLSKIMNTIFTVTAKRDNKLAKKCPTGYVMEVEPYDKNLGPRYRFLRCPIAEFAKAHGYLNIMPAFCNGDYPAMEAISATLVRDKTCANGDYCDYCIVGNKNKYGKEHPMIIDEQGYMRNKVE